MTYDRGSVATKNKTKARILIKKEYRRLGYKVTKISFKGVKYGELVFGVRLKKLRIR